MSLLLDKHGEPVGPPLSDHIELNFFEAGHPFQDASEEQRLAALRAIAAAAKTEFEKSLKALQELVHQCDPISLLAHFGFYDLTFPYRDESIYSPAEQHQVEILQALILMIPESELSRVPPTPEQRLQANKLSEEITHGFIMYRIDPAKISPADSIREQARLATQSIRNPGYSDQVEKNLEELFDPLDGDLLAYRGVTFSGLIHLCRAFRGRMEKRYNSLCQAFRRIRKEKTMEDMLRRFDSEFRVGEEVLEIFRGHIRSENLDADRLCAGLWNYSERVHPVVFAADIDELVADYPTAIERPVLSTALDAWSYRFGELASAKIEHLFLDNPVWRRPLLKINGHTYFWPIIGSFISFGLEMLEEQLVGNDGLKAKYHDRRATFLEQKVASLLSEALPSSTIYKNLVWFDPKQGETDAFALIDQHALIFECKSGRIKPSARRGGGSLFEEIKELIQEPTDQGCRFEALLGASKEPLKLEDKKGHVHEIQRPRIKRVTRVNVLLDFFGVLALRIQVAFGGRLTRTDAHSGSNDVTCRSSKRLCGCSSPLCSSFTICTAAANSRPKLKS
jgi:hypothetical protein